MKQERLRKDVMEMELLGMWSAVAETAAAGSSEASRRNAFLQNNLLSRVKAAPGHVAVAVSFACARTRAFSYVTMCLNKW